MIALQRVVIEGAGRKESRTSCNFWRKKIKCSLTKNCLQKFGVILDMNQNLWAKPLDQDPKSGTALRKNSGSGSALRPMQIQNISNRF
jgi:hypothetical protein